MTKILAKFGKMANTVSHRLDRLAFPAERKWKSRFGAPQRRGLSARMLLVTTDYPPIVSGGIYRTVGLVNAAKVRGWSVDVVVPRVSHKGRSRDEYMERRGLVADQVLDVPPPKREIKRSWIRDVHGGMDQAMATYRAALKATFQRPDVIIASGPSFLSFVTAFWLSRHWRCSLVLDYRDEWTTHAHQLFQRSPRYERMWERRCLAAASMISVTTAGQRDRLISAFDLDRGDERLIVMPNGWDRVDFEASHRSFEPEVSTQVLDIGYFGSLRKTTFVPMLFGHLANRNSNKAAPIKLHIYGDVRVDDPRLGRAAAAGNLSLTDNINRSEVPATMAAMDVLLATFVAGLEDYLPGKLAEYLATDKPLLFVGPDGEAARLIRDLAAGVVVPPDDEMALIEAFDVLAARSPEAFMSTARERWCQDNERQVLCARLLDPLEAVVSEARP